MSGSIEQTIGGLVVAFVLADIYLTVLYARIGAGRMRTLGTGAISSLIARGTWSIFRAIGRRFDRSRGTILAFAGSTILVLLVASWALLLSFGAALLVHPALGTGIVNSGGKTQTDFITALYAAGTSLALTGGSAFEPALPAYQVLYLLNAVIGTFVVSMTVTYVLQVYSAVQRRNTLALNLNLLTRETGDAVELLAGLGPRGRFETGYNELTQLADEIAAVKESLHVYPVMFYFRYPDALYGLARLTLVALDTIALAKSALDDEYDWFKESAAVVQMSAASLVLQTTIEQAFLGSCPHNEPHDEEAHARWRPRFANAIDRLRQAGIATIEDEPSAARHYVELREHWDQRSFRIGQHLAYTVEEVDVAGCRPELAKRRGPFGERRQRMM